MSTGLPRVQDGTSRRRLWKGAGGLVAVSLVLGLGLRQWVATVADRRWSALERSVATLSEFSKPGPFTRPPLLGEPVAGNAWDAYRLALEGCRRIRDFRPLQDFVWKNEQKPEAEALLSSNVDVLESLRRAARCTEVGPPPEPEVLIPLRRVESILTLLVSAEARALLAAGRPRDALTDLLALGQFECDLQRNPATAQGDPLGSRIMDLVREAVLSPALPKGDLGTVAGALRSLERAFPDDSAYLQKQQSDLGRGILAGSEATPPTSDMLRGWRYGFSRRIMASEVFEEFAEDCRRVAASEQLSWRDEQNVMDGISRRRSESRNPIPGWIPRGGYLRRVRLAQIRLLRMAATALETGAFPKEDDPFGSSPLGHERTPDGFKVWSVFSNGVDDGGMGRWDPSPVPGQPAGMPDLVLEVRR